MMRPCYILSQFAFAASAQQLASDPGVLGPPLELVHIYNDQFASGMILTRSNPVIQEALTS